MTRTRGQWIALVAATVSGFSIFLNGYAVKHVHAAPTTYTTAKNAVAALILCAAAAATRRADPGPIRRHVVGVATVGVLGGGVPFILFFEGLARASSSHAAFLQKTLVIWVAVLAVPLLHERLRPLNLTAIGLLVVGQAALGGGVSGIKAGNGELMILAATLLWAVETVIARRLLADVRALNLGAARMAIGCAILVGWLARTGHLSQLGRLDAGAWSWVILMGSVLAVYVLAWFAALAAAPAIDVTSVLVFGALITAALSSGLDGSSISALGTALVLAGTLVVFGRALRQTPAPVG